MIESHLRRTNTWQTKSFIATLRSFQSGFIPIRWFQDRFIQDGDEYICMESLAVELKCGIFTIPSHGDLLWCGRYHLSFPQNLWFVDLWICKKEENPWDHIIHRLRLYMRLLRFLKLVLHWSTLWFIQRVTSNWMKLLFFLYLLSSIDSMDLTWSFCDIWIPLM